MERNAPCMGAFAALKAILNVSFRWEIAMTSRELVAIRDEFARWYGKPEDRFVSVGFKHSPGGPRLSVLVNHNYSRWGLPTEFRGIPVESRYSAPAVLGVGPVL